MPTFGSGYVGDYAPGTVIDIKFTTLAANEAPTALAGTPVVSVFKDNSTTETTAGVTLTTSFDGRAGSNNLRIDTSADATFYSAGSNFQAIITTGTVNSVSVIGVQVGAFSLNKESALRPTTAGRTLDVAATGEAGLDFNNVLSTGLITLHSLNVSQGVQLNGTAGRSPLRVTPFATGTLPMILDFDSNNRSLEFKHIVGDVIYSNLSGSVEYVAGDVNGNIAGNLLGTLTATERTAIANSLLDQANGIETGITMRNALKLMVAALAGELSGGGTTTITIKAANDNATTRITATVDASGNRSAITFNL
jgi:hypothetical protein